MSTQETPNGQPTASAQLLEPGIEHLEFVKRYAELGDWAYNDYAEPSPVRQLTAEEIAKEYK